MYSDNGTAFTGSEKIIKAAMDQWFQQATLDHIATKGTEWRFMTPAAPHQGGMYEAAVKSMKFHLKRVVGLHILPLEGIQTLITQIEAILNSRPIHPLTDDPDDMQALTPGHFLVGEPLIVPTGFNVKETSDTVGGKLYRLRQQMLKHFWDRWSNEYLSTLQERKKWRREKESLKIGQLVLLANENFPPAAWAIGRIIGLKESIDKRIRNVTVRTATGVFERPVQKICIVPVEAKKLDK